MTQVGRGAAHRAGGLTWVGLVLVALVALGGCRGGGDGPSDDPSASATGATECQAGQQGPGCYSLGDIGTAYCWVQEARTLVREGRIEVDDLPTWADRSDVDGAPRIVDFPAGPQDRSSAEASDEIRRALVVDLGLDVDQSEIASCASDLTQEQVESTEGGPARY